MQQNITELKISRVKSWLVGNDGEVITTEPIENSILTLPAPGFVSYENMKPEARVVVFLFEQPSEAGDYKGSLEPPKIKRIAPFWCVK